MRLAVIGSAGRDEAAPISLALYDKMYERLAWYVERWEITSAVSGGAAFADHLAVRAYLAGLVKDLTLYLPAHFENGAYVPNPRIQFNPGKTSNNFHDRFSRKTGVQGLAEIAQAIEKGANVHVFEGFHNRNCEVASHCDYLLAFTFGSKTFTEIRSDDPAFTDHRKAGVKDGGTEHTFNETWNVHAKAHENLSDLVKELG
ncbi:hypothetical protein [Rhizobium sp. MHM7A]|uniref:hypothetical protein n=1 Tax=Rhizobium sp. MHM7A TaxID=2583233 RepID=UPI0011065A54|nr:hypothetical protein [Rhizobium sp. MHM7A]TLX15845.1 hypothetical protein FFR93_00585 [Rhizobium sp. MHM7A]